MSWNTPAGQNTPVQRWNGGTYNTVYRAPAQTYSRPRFQNGYNLTQYNRTAYGSAGTFPDVPQTRYPLPPIQPPGWQAPWWGAPPPAPGPNPWQLRRGGRYY